MEKCVKLADKIDELNEYIGYKKWSDIEHKDLSEKLQFWNDKYEKWNSEKYKMKVLVCRICLFVKVTVGFSWY